MKRPAVDSRTLVVWALFGQIAIGILILMAALIGLVGPLQLPIAGG